MLSIINNKCFKSIASIYPALYKELLIELKDRIIFKWSEGNASEVEIIDYH